MRQFSPKDLARIQRFHNTVGEALEKTGFSVIADGGAKGHGNNHPNETLDPATPILGI